jgi:hypothetical protein
MECGIFEHRLQSAAQQTVAFARQHVRQQLPDDVAFLVYPNQSYDGDPRVDDEEVFPDDSLPKGQYHGPWSTKQVVGFLCRGGKVPEWIDVSVLAEDKKQTFVELHCCGRFTAQDELLYRKYPGGIPPFLIKSPVLPPLWEGVESSGKFDLYWRERPKRSRLRVTVCSLWRAVSAWGRGP